MIPNKIVAAKAAPTINIHQI